MKRLMLRPCVGLLLAVVAAGAFAQNLEVVWMGWPRDSVMQLVGDFEKAHPGIKVDIQLIPFQQLFPTLEVRLKSGTTPDSYLVDGPLTASYAARGYLLPLNDQFSAGELKAFFPSSIEAGSYAGKLYSIPYGTSSAGLFFNRAIFKKYGVPFPPEQPNQRLTWEQVGELARKLTIRGADGQVEVWGLLIEQIDRPYQILPMAQSKGAKAISDDGWTTEGYITSKPFVDAIKFYQKLFMEWKVSPQGIPDAAKSREYFGNGKAAMMLGAEWNISRLPAFKGLEFGLSAHPYFEGGVPVTPTGSWHVGVNSRTKLKAEAVKFTKFITGFDATLKWHKLFGHAPARSDVYDALPETFGKPMWQIFFHEMKATAVPRPASPGFSEYEQILREALNAIHYGAEVETTLRDAAKRIDRELRKYR